MTGSPAAGRRVAVMAWFALAFSMAANKARVAVGETVFLLTSPLHRY